MWAAILLFGILLPVLIIGGGVTFLWTAIAFMRRRSLDIRMSFSTVVLGYLALMMVIGAFITASGVGTVGKVALVQVTSDDFGYNPKTHYNGFDAPRTTTPLTPSDVRDKKDDDVTAGAVLTIVGLLVFGPHALGSASLRRRGAPGGDLVFRGYSLVALAIGTIGFLAAGGTTLSEVLQRLSDGGSGWRGHAVAEPLAFALVLLPLCTWFGYQLWSLVAADIDRSTSRAIPAAEPH